MMIQDRVDPVQKEKHMEEQLRESMYLKSIRLGNFRSCTDTNVEFQPTLALIVGENNSGKSNVVEALRLATAPLGGRRSRYFETDDISHGHEDEAIELALKFAHLTETQRSQYSTALDINTGHAHYGVRFRTSPDTTRPRPTFHASKVWGADVEPDKREQITHV